MDDKVHHLSIRKGYFFHRCKYAGTQINTVDDQERREEQEHMLEKLACRCSSSLLLLLLCAGGATPPPALNHVPVYPQEKFTATFTEMYGPPPSCTTNIFSCCQPWDSVLGTESRKI